MKPEARRALVIGGSISGLFAALYLRRRGWMVNVYERSPVALTGRGAGIMTHPEMRAALAELGLDTGRDFGVPIEGRLVLDVDGRRDRAAHLRADRHLLEPAVRDAERRARAPMLIIWARTFCTSRKTVAGWWRTSPTAHRLRATCWWAPTASARRCARSCCPRRSPLYAGYVAWRGLIDEGAGAAGAGAGGVRPPELRPAAGRAVPGLSGGGAGQRPAARDTAAGTSCGIAPPTRRGRCRAC